MNLDKKRIDGLQLKGNNLNETREQYIRNRID